MTSVNVYHVVTEKPMSLGQVIRFDGEHYNGVYNRVMACKQLLDGKQPIGELSEYINGNLDYWAVRTYRELVLEKMRVEKYPDYPSRMSCLYTSNTLAGADMWAHSFIQSGRKVYQIVRLQTNGKIFNGDAYNVFDGTENHEENERKAIGYWENHLNPYGKQPLVETLIDGKIEVIGIVKEF